MKALSRPWKRHEVLGLVLLYYQSRLLAAEKFLIARLAFTGHKLNREKKYE